MPRTAGVGRVPAGRARTRIRQAGPALGFPLPGPPCPCNAPHLLQPSPGPHPLTAVAPRSRNQIGDAGLAALTPAVAQLTALQRLDLECVGPPGSRRAGRGWRRLEGRA